MQKDKDTLDGVFSEYIRLFYADFNGMCRCVTCGKVGFWKEKNGIQNGHYVTRGSTNTRFDERNCHPQCQDCNMWKDKNKMQIQYRWFMVDKYGEEVVKEIEQLGLKTDLMSPMQRGLWYKSAIEHYKDEVKKLKQQKGL